MLPPDTEEERAILKINNPSLSTRKTGYACLLSSTQSLQYLKPKHIKCLLVKMTDPTDTIRELATQTLLKAISESESIEDCLEHILHLLIDRTNCADLEDIMSMPEPMRPTPSQSPSVMSKLVERTEEVRKYFPALVKDMLDTLDEEFVYENISDFINILRALTMDPCPEIQVDACLVWSSFLANYKNVLENFSSIVCRALLLPLASKKSKTQLAALKALKELLFIGPFKQSVN